MNNLFCNKKSIERNALIIFLCLVFVFFYIFYSLIHPLIPIDLDDWRYLIRNRLFIPIWGEGNPTKIMPEFLYPFISSIGINTFYPFTKDYILSLTIIHSIFISLCITGYIYMFITLLKKRFSVCYSHAILFALIFLLFHFLVFRTRETNNVYMFYAMDLNCYYNYTLPNLLCASIVISLYTNDWLSKNICPTIKSASIIFVLYLALFSNLYSSIILMSYISVDIMLCYYHYGNKNINIIQFIKTNRYKFVLIFVWLIIHIFEANGDRAAAKWTNHKPFILSVKQAFMCLFDINVSPHFVILSIFLSSIGVFFFKKSIYYNDYWKILIPLLFCIIYCVLLSAKVYPLYVLRPDVNYSFVFYAVFFVLIVLLKIYQKYPIIINIIPISSFMLYSFINRTSVTFCDLWRDYDFATIKTIIEKNTNEIIKADESCCDSVIIWVPTVNSGDSWMFSNGVNYNNILFKHGIINHNVHIIMKDDDKALK